MRAVNFVDILYFLFFRRVPLCNDGNPQFIFHKFSASFSWCIFVVRTVYSILMYIDNFKKMYYLANP